MANPRPFAVEPKLGRRHQGGDADHVAESVDQRPAGVARRHGGVGLDQSLQRPGLGGERAVERRDDAEGDGRVAIEIEGVADRQHLVAEADVVGRGERCRAQTRGVDAQQRQVTRRIGGDDRRLAGSLSPLSRTCTVLASPTTWALVTISPSAVTIRPVPMLSPAWPLTTSDDCTATTLGARSLAIASTSSRGSACLARLDHVDAEGRRLAQRPRPLLGPLHADQCAQPALPATRSSPGRARSRPVARVIRRAAVAAWRSVAVRRTVARRARARRSRAVEDSIR